MLMTLKHNPSLPFGRIYWVIPVKKFVGKRINTLLRERILNSQTAEDYSMHGLKCKRN